MDKLLNDSYTFDVFKHLVLPKQVIKNGLIHDIDKKLVKNRLLEIRRRLINNEILYDKDESFGFMRASEDREAHIKDLLLEGQFVLSKNKRKIGFVISDGEKYYPLVDNNKARLEFDLVDLE